MDIDLPEHVQAGPLTLEEQGESVPVPGLSGQRDADRLRVVERAQRAVEDQPFTQLGRKALSRDWTAGSSGP